jgi:hypothetical protein
MKIANWYEYCKLIWELQSYSHVSVSSSYVDVCNFHMRRSENENLFWNRKNVSLRLRWGWRKLNDTFLFSRDQKFVELHLDSVFRFGIGRYFPGILPTDTKGKLGWYVAVSYIWREPLFPSLLPPFWWTKPPFWGEFPQNFTKLSSRQILQHKKYRTYHTEYIPTGKCR